MATRITKRDLTDIVAKGTGNTKAVTQNVIDTLIATITDELRDGNTVTITGFGTFEVRQRQERLGVSPSTGERIKIPAKTYPAFKAGVVLKDAVEKTPF